MEPPTPSIDLYVSEMKAFDLLPKRLQATIRELSIGVSAQAVYWAFINGAPEEALIFRLHQIAEEEARVLLQSRLAPPGSKV